MASRRNVACPVNETLAKFVFEKWEEMAVKETFTDCLNATFSKAYKNLYDHKDPIFDLKGASKIKETQNGKDYMLKQELIDAAEASGLSRMPIGSLLSWSVTAKRGTRRPIRPTQPQLEYNVVEEKEEEVENTKELEDDRGTVHFLVMLACSATNTIDTPKVDRHVKR
ncbi:hypothetical protein KI387_011652 [Taxus chinensis]|uniref:Crossover junction endonuclease MUS81 n=1 Tax=Taxus chinensis TaxID=29808 RepID=A0AA38FBK7_TAXCH|nr:hypothetical protein KI387_011652 [Taxus chinensis]